MAANIFCAKALSLSLIVLITCLSLSVATVHEISTSTEARSSYTLYTTVAAQNPISSKRHLRSNVDMTLSGNGMTTSGNTGTSEERIIWGAVAKMQEGLQKVGLLSAESPASAAFTRLRLSPKLAHDNKHETQKIKTWMDEAMKNNANAPDGGVGEIFDILSRKYNSKSAKLLIPEAHWGKLASKQLTRLKINWANEDFVTNPAFLEWVDFVKAGNSLEDAGFQMFKALQQQNLPRHVAKAVYAKVLEEELMKNEFFGRKLDDGLLQNSKFLDWIGFGSSLNPGELSRILSFRKDVAADEVTGLVQKGNLQRKINSEFVKRGLDKAGVKLYANQEFLKWLKFVKNEAGTFEPDVKALIANTKHVKMKGSI